MYGHPFYMDVNRGINKESRRKLEAMEMRIWRRMLKVSWTQRVTNEKIMR